MTLLVCERNAALAKSAHDIGNDFSLKNISFSASQLLLFSVFLAALSVKVRYYSYICLEQTFLFYFY